MSSVCVANVRGKLRNFVPLLNHSTSRTYFANNIFELGQVIKGKEPKWVEQKDATTLFDGVLKSGQTVFVHGAAATPLVLIAAMTEYGKCNCLEGIQVIHMHTEGKAPYTDPALKDIFRSVSTFMGGNVRQAVADGRGDAIPIFLSEIPFLFSRKIFQPDIALVSTSPPDQHGFCSLGTSVDCARSACLHSKYIVAQVNKQMPRTFGDGLIHMSHIDFAVCVDEQLPQHGGKPPTDVEVKIGKLIGENLVVNGATLQMGIGSIPDAVLHSLKNHQHLGIHSEMFSGGVIDLVNNGNITNAKKPLHTGRIVGSFLVGHQPIYDFVDNNPSIEMLRVDYVNNTKVVAKLPNMTAINSCIEVDLTGQVCSDSIGTRLYSGFGGQVDFIRGAGEALDGKGVPIIALPSATNKKETKIVPTLKVGAGVVTSRAHAQYIVTEHGIAELFGRTILQRAHALINIAHPDHREKLEKAAFERFKAMPRPKC